MCTLSWLLHSDGFEIFFNRDELKSRARALPPKYDDFQDAIFPIDPDGGGTWIALTRSGAVYCLLNNYQAEQVMVPQANLLSRGGIIPKLLTMADADLTDQCKGLCLPQYAPFILCHFPRHLTNDSGTPSFVCWDGNELEVLPLLNPLISSGVSLNEASLNRTKCFQKATASSQSYLAAHMSHDPVRSQLSVCMHREDAQTVSLSHIQGGERVSFRYYDGSPCSAVDAVSEVIFAK